jgi:hypothetical protein
MTVLATLAPTRIAADAALADARESLVYWEERAQQLPLHAVRRRREAREMAVRWHARVTEAERAAYGAGLVGALLLLASERRLPQSLRRSGQLAARRAVQAAGIVLVALVALAVAGAVAAIELLAALLRALG